MGAISGFCFPSSFVVLNTLPEFPDLQRYEKLSLQVVKDGVACYRGYRNQEYAINRETYHKLMSGGVNIKVAQNNKEFKAVLFDDPLCPGYFLNVHLQDEAEVVPLGIITEVHTFHNERCVVKNERGQLIIIKAER